MERIRREKVNTLVAFINQIVTIVCGFVLPRIYLKNYGSEVYGLVVSISQFLGFITLMELGMGAVVQSSLYGPLADKDENQISKIIASADRFFKKVAFVFLGYILILSVLYPFFSSDSFTWVFDASLVIIISISSFAEYFFGITYRLLLLADQKAYVTHGFATVSIIANFVLCIILMNLGCSIHLVKLASTTVLLFRPIGQMLYVEKKYNIKKNITYSKEPIKQKWNGIAQHAAYYITNNTDTIVLTIFSSLQNVAIYSVYNMVVNGFRQLILTLNSGTQALYGEMIAHNEYDELSHHFTRYEILIHAIVVIIYTCVGVLILPFVSIYTSGITDVNYYQPLFAVLITIAVAIYCIRLPYNTLVGAAGHYRQTQTSAINEMILNLGISIILVKSVGLVGVAIGTLLALLYRTIYLAWYIKKIIPGYKFSVFIYKIVVDLISVLLICIATRLIQIKVYDYYTWIIYALEVFMIALAIVIIINTIFNKKMMSMLMESFLKRVFHKL